MRLLTCSRDAGSGAAGLRSTRRKDRAQPLTGTSASHLDTRDLSLVCCPGKFAWGPVLSMRQQRRNSSPRAVGGKEGSGRSGGAGRNEYSREAADDRVESQGSSRRRKDAQRLREELSSRQRRRRTHRPNDERQIQLHTSARGRASREAVDLSVAIASKIIQRKLEEKTSGSSRMPSAGRGQRPRSLTSEIRTRGTARPDRSASRTPERIQPGSAIPRPLTGRRVPSLWRLALTRR